LLTPTSSAAVPLITGSARIPAVETRSGSAIAAVGNDTSY